METEVENSLGPGMTPIVGEIVLANINRVMSSFPPAARAVMDSHREEWYLYLPSSVIQHVADYLQRPGELVELFGFSIHPGYENKVVIAHKDAAINDWARWRYLK